MTAPALRFSFEKLSKEDIALELERKDGTWLQPADGPNAKLLNVVTSRDENKKFEQLMAEKNEHSVNVKTATFHAFCCCFYNCCCCCFNWVKCCGPCCGEQFCFFGHLNCIEIKMRRDRWLWTAHTLCFVLHFTLMCVTIAAGWGKPMQVTLYRIEPEWQDTGRNGFTFAIVDSGATWFHLNVTTGLFFGLSALFHGVWVFLGPWRFSIPFLWKQLDDCLCWW